MSVESNGSDLAQALSIENGDNFFSPVSDDIQESQNTTRTVGSLFEFGFYKYLNEAKNARDLKDRINDLIKSMGFSDYTYSIPDLAVESDVHFLTTPDELRKAYVEGGFYEYDMCTNYGKTQIQPIFGSQIEEYVSDAPFDNDIIKQNREMFRMLKSFGYYDFYLVPIRAPGARKNVMLSVQIRDKPPIALKEAVTKNRGALRQLTEGITDVLWNKFRGDFFNEKSADEVRIGRKPLQLLTVLAKDDLTLNQASDKLCISIHTANQHASAARDALGVCTTIGAVYRAMKLGLISPQKRLLVLGD